MLSYLFFKLKDYAWFRRLVWKPVYHYLSRRFKDARWYFMNYGYDPEPQEPPLQLADNERAEQYQAQLYHYLALKAPVEDKDVLEVGSGRGGGALHIARHLRPRNITGMDIAPSAVELCQRVHHAPNLSFMVGDAEQIPLPDSCMDVVINVESCHTYGSVDRFLAEVKRVLRPGGFLLLADLRGRQGMELLQSQLQQCGLGLVSDEDITENVVRAIEKENDLKLERIQREAPARFAGILGEFTGTVGSQVYLHLKNREQVYHRFVLRKAL